MDGNYITLTLMSALKFENDDLNKISPIDLSHRNIFVRYSFHMDGLHKNTIDLLLRA